MEAFVKILGGERILREKNFCPKNDPESNFSSDMLVHWVKVIWANDGGSGTMGTDNNLFTH